MDKPIIEVKNVSKKFVLSHQRLPYETLRDSMTELVKKPFRLLHSKARMKREDFWALHDINFSVQQGEVVGIIGPNGSGKSTLLKILSQITPPTTGEITMRGHVASLLEVGTGFHPELTGRENIFLNGAILGIAKKEITRKFDEIVQFAGVEKFLDTPVKRYSSGMYVRLAFSVAAHMEPEILIIDEVLAVGDAEFQKKCLEKMESITKTEGRTILFVSHNLIAVQKLCTRAIALEFGRIKNIGNTRQVIEAYLYDKTSTFVNPQLAARGDVGQVRFTNVEIAKTTGSGAIRSHDKLRIAVQYSSNYHDPIPDPRIVISIVSGTSQQIVLRLDSEVTAHSLPTKIQPRGEIICETGQINLIEGTYWVNLDFLIEGENRDHMERASSFSIETTNDVYSYRIPPDPKASDYLVPFTFTQSI